MLDLIAQALALGGNAAMIAVAFAMWRLDRRVVRIETHLFERRTGGRA